MILLFAGTHEGREAACSLKDSGKEFIASVATKQGAQLLKKSLGDINNNMSILCGPLDREQIESIVDIHNVATIIDATHPFAINISKNLIDVAVEREVQLIRIERPRLKLTESHLIEPVADVTSAAELACNLGETLFLTIGSKAAYEFAEIALKAGKKIVTRVMPSGESINKCLDAGFKRENIITGLGPFTKEHNISDFKKYKVDVVISKDSGAEGGLQEKVDAAAELGKKIVLIERPPNPYNNQNKKNINIVSLFKPSVIC